MPDTASSAIPSKPPGSIRVVTLNVWGKNGSWENRRSVLVDGLRKLNPDLIVL